MKGTGGQPAEVAFSYACHVGQLRARAMGNGSGDRRR